VESKLTSHQNSLLEIITAAIVGFEAQKKPIDDQIAELPGLLTSGSPEPAATAPPRAVVRFYNKRGAAEQWIKEGKRAVKLTRLSCHRFRSNEARLWLSVIAYNLGNLWRRLVLPNRIGNWSLTSLQHRLVKTGGRLVKHARYYRLLLAEGHLTGRLFGAMVGRSAGLLVATGLRVAVGTAKSGGQEVRVGEVFMECAEKTGV